MPDQPTILPAWFVKVAAAVVCLVIPWATWVTHTLMVMNVKLDLAAKAEHKVEELREDFQNHVSNPELHGSGFARVGVELESIKRRLDKLEKQ